MSAFVSPSIFAAYAGHHVRRRVQPHQRITARPVDLERQRLPDFRMRHRRRGNVQHGVDRFALACVGDHDALAVLPDQDPRVSGLTATQRVEDRPVELDAALVHRDDLRVRRLQVSVFAEQQLGGHEQAQSASARATMRSWCSRCLVSQRWT